jgi:hypothetical protein
MTAHDAFLLGIFLGAGAVLCGLLVGTIVNWHRP